MQCLPTTFHARNTQQLGSAVCWLHAAGHPKGECVYTVRGEEPIDWLARRLAFYPPSPSLSITLALSSSVSLPLPPSLSSLSISSSLSELRSHSRVPFYLVTPGTCAVALFIIIINPCSCATKASRWGTFPLTVVSHPHPHHPPHTFVRSSRCCH